MPGGMIVPMREVLSQLAEGETLDEPSAAEAFGMVMRGEAEPVQIAAMLSMMQVRGVTVDELVGAARAMRDHVVRVKVPQGLTAVDTCGTGGDHSGTFNISTAAAIVAAAAGRDAGLCVAKHGNRSVTSKSGSSQVLEVLGVNLQASGEALTACLDQAGIAFCFAPQHHPAMRHAGPVRQSLGFRTIFNLVGPLTNPAGATRQVVGVFAPGLTEIMAEVLQRLGAQAAVVVHGTIPDEDSRYSDALDELSTCGASRVTTLLDGRISTARFESTSLGLPLGHPSALRVDSPEASAALIGKVLDGQHGPARDIVALNASAALVVGGVVNELGQGLDMTFEAIDSGRAKATLKALVETSHA